MATRRRSWDSLSPSYQRRLIAAHGGAGTRAHRIGKARQAYEAGIGLTPEQRGHEPAQTRAGYSITAHVGPDARRVEFQGLDRGERRRLGRYDHLVRQLSYGRITSAEFERRVRRMRPVAGQRLSSDPGAVLAELDRLRAADVEPFTYRSGRAA